MAHAIEKVTEDNLDKVMRELSNAVLDTCQPRSNVQLEKFVVGDHETVERQYKQCVDELSVKILSIRTTIYDQKISLSKIKWYEAEAEALRKKAKDTPLTPKEQFQLEKHEIEVEKMKIYLDMGRIQLEGNIREANTLWRIFNSFEKKYSHAEIQAGEERYWYKRFSRHAQAALEAGGGIDVGVADALRKLGPRQDLGSKFLAEQVILGRVPEEIQRDLSEKEPEAYRQALSEATALFAQRQLQQAQRASLSAKIADAGEEPDLNQQSDETSPSLEFPTT